MANSTIVIDVDNQALLEAIEKMPNTAQGLIARASLATGRAIVQGAKARVPVRFGFLRDSIDIKGSKTGDVYVGIARGRKFTIPGTKTFSGKSEIAMPSKYAHLVERGTEHSRAKPFLWPATRAESANHRRRLRDALQDAINDTGLGD